MAPKIMKQDYKDLIYDEPAARESELLGLVAGLSTVSHEGKVKRAYLVAYEDLYSRAEQLEADYVCKTTPYRLENLIILAGDAYRKK